MEVELKFKLENERQGLDIINSGFIRNYISGEIHTLRMDSVYYTDPYGEFTRLDYTLRLRTENEKSVCTLKWGGERESGLKRRNELEFEAPDIGQGVELLCANGAPDDFIAAARSELTVTARVSFIRRALMLSIGGADVELSFDRGELGSVNKIPFFELELELKSGSEAVMLGFSDTLKTMFKLSPQEKSKYHRALLADA